MNRRSESGFSLLELLVVLVIIGVLVAISVPALGRYFHQYRLNKVTREIKGNLQVARLKAVTSNFDVVFTYDIGTGGNPDTYQITGDEDIDGGGLQAWEDVNGNGINDGLSDLDRNAANGLESANLFADNQRVEYGNFGTNGLSALPNGNTNLSPTSPINITFNSKGNFVSNYTGNCIVIQNPMQMTQAVCIYGGGYLKTFRTDPSGSWKEFF